jgi:hypothetical protein
MLRCSNRLVVSDRLICERTNRQIDKQSRRNVRGNGIRIPAASLPNLICGAARILLIPYLFMRFPEYFAERRCEPENAELARVNRSSPRYVEAPDRTP